MRYKCCFGLTIGDTLFVLYYKPKNKVFGFATGIYLVDRSNFENSEDYRKEILRILTLPEQELIEMCKELIALDVASNTKECVKENIARDEWRQIHKAIKNMSFEIDIDTE